MLSFFTTAKPFRGHDGIIQRNALLSWKLLHPDVEVILFGDEGGAAEVCAEYGLRHEAAVERYNMKTPYANALFGRAQQIAKHEYVCYSNCDVIFMEDFCRAFEKARAWQKRFMMVSRRRDIDVTNLIDFTQAGWSEYLRRTALTRGLKQKQDFVDFFLFPKGLYEEMPPLVVGYAYWDHWLVWKALSENVAVLDASAFVAPVHQNHGYNTTDRTKGGTTDATAIHNLTLAGSWKHLRHIGDCTYRMKRDGRIIANLYRHKRIVGDPYRRTVRFLRFDVWNPVWFFFLDITRPLRSALGLRSKAMRQSREKA